MYLCILNLHVSQAQYFYTHIYTINRQHLRNERKLNLFLNLLIFNNLIFLHFINVSPIFQVFDDVCSELAMAILQFFQGKPPEEQVFRCMKALNKFCTIAHREVPQLVKMIGPEPSKFSGMSARIDTFIESINARLATVPSF